MRGLNDEIENWSLAATYKIISNRFWWPKVWVDVSHFVRSCKSCDKSNLSEQNEQYGSTPFSGLFQTWSIYFAGSLKEKPAGNISVLLAVENLSSSTVASASGSNYSNTSGVIKSIEGIICQLYANLISTLSDGDLKLESATVRDYAAIFSINYKINQLTTQNEIR